MCGYRLERDGVVVYLEDIGEGLSGEYDPSDPNDVELLRMTVCRGGATVNEDEPVEDGSYCTGISAYASREELRRLCEIIMDRVHGPLTAGQSIKRICEELSWLSEEDLKTKS
jgi:hypothetical protein